MINTIPAFDHNLVLPPHAGNPADPSQLSPYPCTTTELCRQLGRTPERRAILGKYLEFRERIRKAGIVNGFQWLDGSFLEDVETREGRPPNDLDLVTVYWGYDRAFLDAVKASFIEFASPRLAKAAYRLDHYPFNAGLHPALTLEETRYWVLLFSHNRQGVWKGMLRIELNTPVEDAQARQELGVQP